MITNVTDSSMSVAAISATTVDNLAFGVKKGQPVDILLINLNSNVTTMVIGPTAIQDNIQNLVHMTNDVAFNKDLLEKVSNFISCGSLKCQSQPVELKLDF